MIEIAVVKSSVKHKFKGQVIRLFRRQQWLINITKLERAVGLQSGLATPCGHGTRLRLQLLRWDNETT